MPPITSMTTSMSPRVTSAWASVVNNSRGRSTFRTLSIRRTPTPASSSGAPTRATRSLACSWRSRATSLPTTPQPSSATRTGWFPGWFMAAFLAQRGQGLASARAREPVAGPSVVVAVRVPQKNPGCKTSRVEHFQAEEVLLGLAAHDEPCPPLADGHDGGTAYVVVGVGHGTAVRTGCRDRQQVAFAHVTRDELVLDDDVAAFAMLPDHTAEDRRRG